MLGRLGFRVFEATGAISTFPKYQARPPCFGKLFLYEYKDIELAVLLNSQHALRHLQCGIIGNASFTELRQMPNLGILHAGFDENMTGELENVKDLEIENISTKVTFPKLEKLSVVGPSFPLHEHFAALSGISKNLQHIEIAHVKINILPVIVEHFQRLKTLVLNCTTNEGCTRRPPPIQNLCLEELIIRNRDRNSPMGPVYGTINACPNLKRIQLYDATLPEHHILGLIQNHPRLTHFRISNSDGFFRGRSSKVVFLDPLSMKIINIFRSPPAIVQLDFSGVFDWGNQKVEDLLGADADRINITKETRPHIDLCVLLLGKKTREPVQSASSDGINFLY